MGTLFGHAIPGVTCIVLGLWWLCKVIAHRNKVPFDVIQVHRGYGQALLIVINLIV